MLNKFSLRLKITLLTAITLTLMCVCMTVISVLNTDVFYDPIASVIDKQPISEEEIDISATSRTAEIKNVNIAGELYIGSRNKFKALSVITSAGIIIIGTFVSYFLSGRSLKSLKTLTNKIIEINENNLSEKITQNSNCDEVSKLTNAFNHLLEKLGRAFDSQKLFAANAAHELKTPLTNILTNIEVMQMEDHPTISDYEDVTSITKENIERLTGLVKDLLYFNSEPDESNFESINTIALFEKILVDLSHAMLEKNISVSIKGGSIINGDKSLLERAFFNIIQNAVKYNNENGEIKITTNAGTIKIEDTGIGIPPGSLPRIFDPFYCADRSRSRKLGGNGLGLSIAKQIFDKHDMKITVLSQQGEGTKIIIKI